MKACKDCLHYERYGLTAGICWHPDARGFDPVSGPHQTYADNQRHGGKCGPEGRLFEQGQPASGLNRVRKFFMVEDRSPF